jgi:hypothetical protein
MNFLIRPTDSCCCGSNKLYRNCCSSLTRLPPNASQELRLRYWIKYTNDAIAVLLSSLDSGCRLDDARYITELDTEIERLGSIDDYAGLEVIDILALFHLPAHALLDDDAQEMTEDGEVLTKDSPALELPLGVLAAMAEARFEKSPQRDVFRELAARPFSWFEVVEQSPEETLTLRDLILDRQIVITSKTLSKSTNPGDILCGKVLDFDGISLFSGVLPMALPPRSKPEIEKAKERLIKFIEEEFDDRLDPTSLTYAAMEVVRLFVNVACTQGPGSRPELRNTEGDLLEMRDLIYSWTASSVSEIAGRVTQVLESIPDGPDPEITAKDQSGQPTEITIRYVEAAPKDSMMDNVIVAVVVVKPGDVKVSVNSSRRAERLYQKLARLDDILNFEDEVIHPLDGFEAPSSTQSAQNFDPYTMPPENLEAVRDKFKDYQEKWLTQPIPALNGMTPIEAAKSQKMRPALAALLDDFEERDTRAKAKGNLFTPLNASELRERLGFKKT